MAISVLGCWIQIGNTPETSILLEGKRYKEHTRGRHPPGMCLAIPAMTSNGESDSSPQANGSWTFLSNHTHVLLCLARDPASRLRDIAAEVGMTERGVFRVVTDLERGGVITRRREGRRNRYEIDMAAPLRHRLEAKRTVGGLLALLLDPREADQLGLLDANGSSAE